MLGGKPVRRLSPPYRWIWLIGHYRHGCRVLDIVGDVRIHCLKDSIFGRWSVTARRMSFIRPNRDGHHILVRRDSFGLAHDLLWGESSFDDRRMDMDIEAIARETDVVGPGRGI